MNALSPRHRLPIVTVTLIAVSVAVSLLSGFHLIPALMISTDGGFGEIASGEVWRLVTPIFLHGGPLHIFFNMLWMWDLSRLVELVKGPLFLGIFVVVTAIASNLLQFVITGSPNFGGMSGVIYALLGYVWMQGKYNPGFGFVLHQSTVIMMLAWYVLCWTGLLGPIANWAHTGGLVLGVAWGFLDAKNSRKARR
jgi:membrane associated rhomboid family serine protease